MPKNKNAVIRYQVLDKCFANTGRKYYIDDLVEECNKVLSYHEGDHVFVKKRTVQSDITYMESEAGFSIPLDRIPDGRKKYFRYSDPQFSINKNILNEDEKNNLGSALSILSKLDGFAQFNWLPELVTRLKSEIVIIESPNKIVEYEQNPYLKGMEHFEDIFNAIVNQAALEIKYKSFKNIEAKLSTVHPYYLKQFNNRWFLFGKTVGHDTISNYAIDRILATSQSKAKFIRNTTIDFTDHFYDVIGVTINDEQPQKVILKIDNKLYPYIKSKPFHGSQKEISINTDFAKIQLNVIPNYELEQLILSKGEGIEVLSPESFRNTIKERISSMFSNYS